MSTQPNHSQSKYRPWSEQEDAYLLEHWQDTLEQLTKALRRGLVTVRSRIQTLKSRAFAKGECLPSREREAWAPTQAEIRAACLVIQQGWSRRERESRAKYLCADAVVELKEASEDVFGRLRRGGK